MDSGCSKKISFDFSKIAYPGQRQEMDSWEVILKCVVVGTLILVAVMGNLLIIVLVYLSRKMRTTTNFYIVNLAIADLLVACFPMWIYVTTDVTDGFILGGFLCKFNAFVQTTAISAISFTMMAIAGDRFFAIVFPLKARVTQRKVKVVVFFIWLFAASIGIPPLLFYTYTERQWKDYLETWCSDIWPILETSEGCDQGATSERIYWTITVAVLNWIPMLMMTVNYTVIVHKLRFVRVAAHRGKDAISLVQRRSASKVIKMLFSLLIAFMVCTIPFQVSTLYENYKDKKTKLPSWYQPVYFSAINLMYGHSSVNPIIYGAMNQSFRTGFRHLINRIKGRKMTSWDYGTAMESTIRPNVHVIERPGDLDKRNGNANEDRGNITSLEINRAQTIPTSGIVSDKIIREVDKLGINKKRYEYAVVDKDVDNSSSDFCNEETTQGEPSIHRDNGDNNASDKNKITTRGLNLSQGHTNTSFDYYDTIVDSHSRIDDTNIDFGGDSCPEDNCSKTNVNVCVGELVLTTAYLNKAIVVDD